MRRCLPLAVLAVLAVLVLPSPASAHAYLARSSPADGAVLDRAPEVLTLSFTESVEVAQTRVTIVDGDGRRFEARSVSIRGNADSTDTESPMDVVVGLPALPPNTYHLTWRTLSSDDLHVTSGNLVIGVGRPVPAASRPPGPGGPAPLESVLRAASLLGLSTLLGGFALALLLAGGRGTVDVRLRRRLLDTAAAGGALALVAVPAQLAAQVYASRSGAGRLLLHEALGARWLARELGTAAVVAAVLLARSRLTGRAPAIVLGLAGLAGALAAAAGTAALGHPAGAAFTGTLTGTIHVLAAGGWAGAVIAAAIALVPVLRDGGSRGDRIVALLRGFTVLAAGCLAALTVTGLLLAGAQVATADAALTTPYGLLLLGKVGTVVVSAALGLHTARLLRRTAPVVPVRALVTESALLAVVFVFAGALAAAGPARGPRFVTGPDVATAPQVTGQVADLIDTVAVRPNQPGRNIVTISIEETRRPTLAAISGVSLVLHSPDGMQTVHPVVRTAEGWAVTIDDIQRAGAWRISVTVLRDGLPPVTDTHPWGVATGGAQVKPLVSARPLRPATEASAAMVALVATVTGLISYYRRRQSNRRRPPADVVEKMGDRPAIT
jgi:copper transport protein